MSTTPWPQRPPDPVLDPAAWWEGTPDTPADLVRIRRELRLEVARRPWPHVEDADLERLLLVVEELASNGLRHGSPPVHVRVTTLPGGWLLDVSDAAAGRPPAPARGRDPAAGGLGLPLVARLSAAHGWTVRGDRKHVWARIAATAPPEPSKGVVPVPRRKAPPTGGRPGAGPSRARIRGVLDDRAVELGFLPTLGMTGPVPDLRSDVVTDLLAVLGEALTNVARHALADSVHVTLAVTATDVTLRVRDDGIGLAAANAETGLADLRRRAAWHGGTLSVQPEPAGGTRLTWTVPRPPSTP